MAAISDKINDFVRFSQEVSDIFSGQEINM